MSVWNAESCYPQGQINAIYFKPKVSYVTFGQCNNLNENDFIRSYV